MRTIKTVDLVNDFKRVSAWLEENNREWVTVSRPKNKNIVLMTETEANELARAKRNLEYLTKLDKALEDTRENGGYVFDLKTGTFSDTPVKVNI